MTRAKIQAHKPDFLLLFLVLALVLFGLLMIYNSSPVTSLRDFGDPIFLFRQQLYWLGVGIFLGLLVYIFHYSFWEKLAPFILFFGILLLLSVFIPGIGTEIYGAQRWLRVGGFSVQPAEFVKLGFIIYSSAFLAKKVRAVPFLLVSFLLLGIVLVQKDLGTAIIFVMLTLILYFLAGGALWHLALLIPVLLAGIAVLIFAYDYRRARFLAFLNPNLDPQGITYHISQALIAIGSGGWFGVGLGESRQKYGFIPEVTTDSIFAVIGNEIGFVGSTLLILIFVGILYRSLKIASEAPDTFSFLLASGVSAWIGIQAFINLGGMVALLPITGVPLPFISTGGSSLVSILIGIAILLNISKYTVRKNEKK